MTPDAKTLVMYGAGNIGRGFIGHLFGRAGWKVNFIDVNDELVRRLKADRSYRVYVTDGDDYRREEVSPVDAVDGRDTDAVAAALAKADLAATAVGVNVLPRIAAPLAAGINRRFDERNESPFHILVCENLLEADKLLKSLVAVHIKPEHAGRFERLVGFVEASIGRMVPAPPKELLEADPLAVTVEPYAELPVDRAAFKCEPPELPFLLPFSPFSFHIERKLYLHNMSHAMTAYLGALASVGTVWEAVGRPAIELLVYKAMIESAAALSAEHDVPVSELLSFADDLLVRYRNRLLGDTEGRVGRDLRRKLGENDRFAGIARLCAKHGVVPRYICLGYAAGLRFPLADMESDGEVAALARKKGPRAAALSLGFPDDERLLSLVEDWYDRLGRGACSL